MVRTILKRQKISTIWRSTLISRGRQTTVFFNMIRLSTTVHRTQPCSLWTMIKMMTSLLNQRLLESVVHLLKEPKQNQPATSISVSCRTSHLSWARKKKQSRHQKQTLQTKILLQRQMLPQQVMRSLLKKNNRPAEMIPLKILFSA